ncbi:MAG: hypothetical protein ACRCZI_02890 [Cetobacterium sp.]
MERPLFFSAYLNVLFYSSLGEIICKNFVEFGCMQLQTGAIHRLLFRCADRVGSTFQEMAIIFFYLFERTFL